MMRRCATMRSIRLRVGVGLLVGLLGSMVLLGSCKSKSNDPEPVVIKQIWYSPAWSPDGTEIACIVRRYGDSATAGLYLSVLDASTGNVHRERRAENYPLPFAFSWTPDGEWLLFGANPGIFKLSSDLDSLVQLTSGQFHTSPSYSLARNLVFFTSNNPPIGGLFSITLDGDSLHRWSTAETAVLGTATYPDESDSLVGFDAMQIPFRLIVFSPDAISSALFLGGASDDPIAYISADHRYIAFNRQISGSRDLVLLDRASDSSWTIPSEMSEEMSFSPDGKKLVHPIVRGKEIGLWILDLATGEQRRLTDGTQ